MSSTANTVTVEIDAQVADIRVTAAEGAEATASVTPSNPKRKGDVEHAEQTTVELAGGVLRITTPRQDKASLRAKSVDIAVQLPAGSAVSVKTAMGGLTTSGRLGDVTVVGNLGDVTVAEAGRIDVRLDKGNVVVGRTDGGVSVASSYGDVRVDRLTGGDTRLDVSYGAITVGVAEGTRLGVLETSTGFGSTRNDIGVDGNAGERVANLFAKTGFGSIAIQRVK